MKYERHAAMSRARRETERGVLSRMLTDEDAVYTVVESLEPGHFLSSAYRVIYGEMMALFNMGKRVEPDGLKKRLAKRPGIEGNWLARTVGLLAGGNPVGETLEAMVRQLRDANLESRLEEVADMLTGNGEDTPDPERRAREGLAMLEQIVEKQCPLRIDTPDTLARATFRKVADRRAFTPGENTEGIPMPYRDLGRYIRTFTGLNFAVLAGRPGQGKTAFVTSLAAKVAASGHPVGIISAEMSADMLMLRLTALIGNIPLSRMLDGTITDAGYISIANKLDEVAALPIHMVTPRMLSPLSLRNQVRYLKEHHGVKVVVVDSLELMHVAGCSSREEEITVLAREMGQITRELDVFVMLTAQLLPGIELRSEGRPKLADIPGSIALAAHADLVMTLEKRGNHIPEPANLVELELQVLKNRTGAVGRILLAFLTEFVSVENYLPME